MTVTLPPWKLVVGADERQPTGDGGGDDEAVERVFVHHLRRFGDALFVIGFKDVGRNVDRHDIPLRKMCKDVHRAGRRRDGFLALEVDNFHQRRCRDIVAVGKRLDVVADGVGQVVPVVGYEPQCDVGVNQKLSHNPSPNGSATSSR